MSSHITCGQECPPGYGTDMRFLALAISGAVCGSPALKEETQHKTQAQASPKTHADAQQTYTATNTTQDNDAGTSTHTAHTAQTRTHTRGTDTSKPNDTDAQQTDTATI